METKMKSCAEECTITSREINGSHAFYARHVRTWNSVMSTLRAPSKRRDVVIDEITWAIRRFKLVYVGRYVKNKGTWVSELGTMRYRFTSSIENCF